MGELLADFQAAGFVNAEPEDVPIEGYMLDQFGIRQAGPDGVLNAHAMGNMQLHRPGPFAEQAVWEPQRANVIRFDIARVVNDFALTIASIEQAKQEGSRVVVPVRPQNAEPYYLWMDAGDFWPPLYPRGGDGRFQVRIVMNLLLNGMLARGRPTGHSQFAWFHHACPWQGQENDTGEQLLQRALLEMLRSNVQQNVDHFHGNANMRYGDLELFTPNFGGGRITFDPRELRATFSNHYEHYYIIQDFWDAVTWQAGRGGQNAELPGVLANHLEDGNRRTPQNFGL